MLVLAVAVLGRLQLLLQRTAFGREMRATSQDPDTAGRSPRLSGAGRADVAARPAPARQPVAIGTWVVAEVLALLVILDHTLGGGTGISLRGLNVYSPATRRAYTLPPSPTGHGHNPTLALARRGTARDVNQRESHVCAF
jgi:hypothetical protein